MIIFRLVLPYKIIHSNILLKIGLLEHFIESIDQYNSRIYRDSVNLLID